MRGRVANLVPIKYERMLASPFGFFRGAVPVMAADLATLPSSGIINQICGDAHVRNLGAYAAPDGRLVFDINDFDETTRAPFEWDLKRLATSLVLAGREIGEKDPACGDSVLQFIGSYRRLIANFSRSPLLEIARYQVHRLQRITPVSAALHKAERETPDATLQRLTIPGNDPATGARRVFRENKPLLTPLNTAHARPVLAGLHAYRESLLPERQHLISQYRPLEVAFKVVGTGSVGLRDYLIYLEGNGPADPLFLQVKEEAGSAYARYMPNPAAPRHEGCRVAEGQRAMQLQSDPFLGWTTIADRHYLVRQLSDHKASIELEDLKGGGLLQFGELCGELLARGHARSGDANLLFGYLGTSDKFDQALARFAFQYADQTTKDWEVLRKAHNAGAPSGSAQASMPARQKRKSSPAK